MVGLAVIIHIDGHVTRHLTTLQVTTDIESRTDCLHPFFRPRFVTTFRLQRAHGLGINILRQDSGVDTAGAQEAERSCRRIANSDATARGIIATALQFQMEPHDKLPGLFIIHHLRTLQDAATFYIAATLVTHTQCHTLIIPADQILGRIAGNADKGITGMRRLMLTIPIVGVSIFENSASMGIDMLAVVVWPKLSGVYAPADNLLMLVVALDLLAENQLVAREVHFKKQGIRR